MNADLTQQLNETYPKLFLFHNFRSVSHFHFECGDGWFHLINALCNRIQSYIEYNNSQRERLLEAIDMIDNGYRDEVPRYLLNKLEAIDNGNGEFPEEIEYPEFQQIKEKFGTLSIYVNKWDDIVTELIALTEDLSSHTCEECGNIGQLRGGNWIKTLCDKHHAERQIALAKGTAS